jgi:hypothetical protein
MQCGGTNVFNACNLDVMCNSFYGNTFEIFDTNYRLRMIFFKSKFGNLLENELEDIIQSTVCYNPSNNETQGLSLLFSLEPCVYQEAFDPVKMICYPTSDTSFDLLWNNLNDPMTMTLNIVAIILICLTFFFTLYLCFRRKIDLEFIDQKNK